MVNRTENKKAGKDLCLVDTKKICQMPLQKSRRRVC
jgi:hypothetical protein